MSAAPRLDHLGVVVRSIDEALRFYRDALGIEPGERIAVEHEGVEVAMLPLGDTRIELLRPTDKDSAAARFLEKRGEGPHHVALEVDDLEAAIERLRAAGRRLTTDLPQIGAEGYRYVFVHPADAGGVLIELIERPR